MLQLLPLLAQIPVFDDSPDTPPPPPRRPMSFSDLQSGFRNWNDGPSDRTFLYGFLVVVALVAVLALVVHIRQRRRTRKEPDSARSLAWELSRLVPFPLGTRVLLWWVARSTQTPFAALLISSGQFEAAVRAWAAVPTFALLRRFGARRLERLQRVLFETPVTA